MSLATVEMCSNEFAALEQPSKWSCCFQKNQDEPSQRTKNNTDEPLESQVKCSFTFDRSLFRNLVDSCQVFHHLSELSSIQSGSNLSNWEDFNLKSRSGRFCPKFTKCFAGVPYGANSKCAGKALSCRIEWWVKHQNPTLWDLGFEWSDFKVWPW